MCILLALALFTSCDEDCEVNPDLTSDLLAPSSDLIMGEPVDWDYVVTSVRDNSDDCDILDAIASIGEIVIDFFEDENDTGTQRYQNQNQINGLSAGEYNTATNTIDVFDTEGIYFVAVEADKTNVVEERNEDNNKDNSEVTARTTDLFSKASQTFIEKLNQSSAIVVIGRELKNNKGTLIKSFNGKPIYYVNQ